MVFAERIAILIEGYALAGLLFAIAFVVRGVAAIDPIARGAGIGFRLLILPGAAALWPMLLVRWIRGRI
jgi:hypothetical protein